MNLYTMEHPFKDVPVEVRRAALSEATQRARSAFETGFPKLRSWFDEYDPLYVLSFCLFYFLSAPQGVDKEAVDGKLEFGSHHLELLQAFALMGPRLGTPAPLKERAEELRRTLKELTDALLFGDVRITPDTPDVEVKKRILLAQMRGQTLAVRNWAFPEQTVRHLKGLYGGTFGTRLQGALGVDIGRLVDTLMGLQRKVDDKLTAHLLRLRPAMVAKDVDSVHDEYHAAFGLEGEREATREILGRVCGGQLRNLKGLLMAHSDLYLPDVFTFSLEDIAESYGDVVSIEGLRSVLNQWSYAFGDLATANPRHFLYTNPVLTKPFIRLDSDRFFWALSGIVTHTLPGMLELLIPDNLRDKYLSARSEYLESTVAELCRQYFPHGQVVAGSQWTPTDSESTIYENDVLVVVDTTALVIEAKAHLLDAPARRGAEHRFVDTLEDQVVEASTQAMRFVDFLKARPVVHHFRTRRGSTNVVDVRKTLRFVPLSVTFENLGFISANIRRCVEGGLLPDHRLVPSLALSDFEVCLDLLDSQCQRIHYFARRAEIEQTMDYFGDESDLLAFYLKTGFSLGDWEDGGMAMNLGMMSKELDPYFVAKADGVAIPKPRRDLSEWWRDILDRLETGRIPAWTEAAYILLGVGREMQDDFERKVERLGLRVIKGAAPHRHNWIVLRNESKKQPYAIMGFPYRLKGRQERDEMISGMVGECDAESPVLGLVVVGINVDVGTHPYDVLVYAPGHAVGAPDVSRLHVGATATGTTRD